MQKNHLSSYFSGVATKRLSAVEAHPERSNQHEFDGVSALRTILGTEKQRLPARFIYLADDEEDTLTADGFVTWYDARENHPIRSEYRLYFPTTAVSALTAEGDRVVFGRRTDGSMLVIITRKGSTAEQQILWLFDLQESLESLLVRPVEYGRADEIGFAAEHVLEELGIIVQQPEDDSLLEAMLRTFGEEFPATKVFSAFARNSLPDISCLDDPDDALLTWMDREEQLFRMLERHIVGRRLEENFADVDDFVTYSLSVQNRRKSRAGHALENHLEEILQKHRISYGRNVITENRSRPDFIFPGELAYRDLGFPSQDLTMLGVKSSCKDRWRQVLAEAKRIDRKHLLTLEPGISEGQTQEMESHSLTLVIPQSIQSSYLPAQQQLLMDVREFLVLVRQRAAPHAPPT